MEPGAASASALGPAPASSEPHFLDNFFSSLERGRLATLSIKNRAASPSLSDADIDLTWQGAQLLVDAFMLHIASGLTWLQRKALIQCLSDVHREWIWDPRWPALIRSRLFLAAIQWVGARAVLDKGASPMDSSYSRTLPLSSLLPLLERRFVSLLRSELERFWKEAELLADRKNPELLQTTENLSLVLTLIVVIACLITQMSRIDGARTLIIQIAAIYRATRLPGELSSVPITGMDDFLLAQCWIDTFHITVALDGMLATTGRTRTIIDLPREFPRVPMSQPAVALSSVPSPAERGIVNGPMPAGPLRDAVPLTCLEHLGWIDPTLQQPLPSPSKLIGLMGNSLVEGGTVHMGMKIFFGMSKVAAYSEWLKKEAGLTLISVLVVEDVLDRGKAASHVDPVYLSLVLANPNLQEAIRRRRHLWMAMVLIEKSLPEDLGRAARDSDFETLIRLANVFPAGSGRQIVGILSVLRQTIMLLVSPEPFEDLAEPWTSTTEIAVGTSDESVSLVTSTSDLSSTLLESWFSSPSFQLASRNAIIISDNMRMIASRIATEELQGTYALFAFCCLSASHAAWFHLLVLRRFRNLIVASHAIEQARALALYDDIRRDIGACIDLLEISGQTGYRATGTLLRNIMDDADSQLSPADVQMLRQAQAAVKFCEHIESGEAGDGECYLCAAQRAKGRSGELDVKESGDLSLVETLVEGSGDPLVALAGLRLKKGKRRVRFSERVEIRETYSADDYPARTMAASDEVSSSDEETDGGEEEEQAEKITGVREESALATLLHERDARKLPNLTSYWYLKHAVIL